MKNKIIATLMSAVLVIGALAGCGGSGPSKENAESSKKEDASVEDAEADEAESTEGEESEEGAVANHVIEGSNDLTLTLAWMGDGGNKEALETCIRPYVEETGNSVEIIFFGGVSWAEYFTKIQTMIASGQTIDCANVAIEGFEMVVNLGLAQPIDDWIANNQDVYDEIANDIEPSILNVMNFDGKQYGLPFEWNNVCTHINTKLLEEAGLELPPADWDKELFLEYCEALTKEREDGSKQFAVLAPSSYFELNAWLYNFGGSVMNEDMTESNLLDPKTVEAIQFARDLVHEYGYAPMPGELVDTYADFENGNLAMFWAGRWPTSQYMEVGFKDVAVQYMPTFNQNEVVWGGTGIFTMADSEHPDEATALSVYLSSPKFVQEYMSDGAIPVLQSIAEDVVVGLGIPQNAEVYIESAAKTRAVQAPTQYPEIATLIEGMMRDIRSDPSVDVQSALEEAHDQLNLILSE